jgi:hypothetical protein
MKQLKNYFFITQNRKEIYSLHICLLVLLQMSKIELNYPHCIKIRLDGGVDVLPTSRRM